MASCQTDHVDNLEGLFGLALKYQEDKNESELKSVLISILDFLQDKIKPTEISKYDQDQNYAAFHLKRIYLNQEDFVNYKKMCELCTNYKKKLIMLINLAVDLVKMKKWNESLKKSQSAELYLLECSPNEISTRLYKNIKINKAVAMYGLYLDNKDLFLLSKSQEIIMEIIKIDPNHNITLKYIFILEEPDNPKNIDKFYNMIDSISR
jgi:hypothetical protein